MTIRERDSRILFEAREFAIEWHAGVLSCKRRMREFYALCRLNVEGASAGPIRALRERVQLSQVMFAVVLNPSEFTGRQRESGDKRSGGLLGRAHRARLLVRPKRVCG